MVYFQGRAVKLPGTICPATKPSYLGVPINLNPRGAAVRSRLQGRREKKKAESQSWGPGGVFFKAPFFGRYKRKGSISSIKNWCSLIWDMFFFWGDFYRSVFSWWWFLDGCLGPQLEDPPKAGPASSSRTNPCRSRRSKPKGWFGWFPMIRRFTQPPQKNRGEKKGGVKKNACEKRVWFMWSKDGTANLKLEDWCVDVIHWSMEPIVNSWNF